MIVEAFVLFSIGMESKNLSDRRQSAEFYEERYSHGYMGFWSAFEKERLLDLIRELDLPAQGKALDFGCGRGIFTQVFRQALPGWEIFGCDISTEAIAFAKNNSPGITFFVLGDPAFQSEKFDFIHSHHVLEHTFDAKITAEEMSSYANTRCVMLHSLPCNHPGSLEHKLSLSRKNGIDPKTGKFFFEDEAHMRRMSVEDTAGLFRSNGFSIWKDYYANQYYGALKWIVESDFRMVLTITNPLRANSFKDFLFLLRMRAKLKFYFVSFFAATAFHASDRGRFFIFKKILQAISFVLFFWFAIPVRSRLINLANEEWRLRRNDKNGSDLFLILKRQ